MDSITQTFDIYVHIVCLWLHIWVNAQLHKVSHSFDMTLDNINGSLKESS